MAGATDEVRLARAALTRICEPGSHGLADLIDRHGPVETLALLRRSGPPPHDIARDVLARRAEDLAAHDLDAVHRLGGRLVCPEDDEWPAQVDQLDAVSAAADPVKSPVALWVRGHPELAATCERAVSVVGARAATAYGSHVASELAYGLADRECTVVSGGAYGIDGAAHRGALAAGGPTVAVLASGVDRPYPLGHHSLFERIAAVGLLVSEWPPGCPPRRLRFLVRNRVIAALSAGTVVVEAAARSGARMTARRAVELNRALMAVPGPVTSAMSVGTHQLIRSGGAILVSTAAEILDAAGRIGADLAEPPRGPVIRRDELDPALLPVLEAMPGRGESAAEDLARQAGVGLRDGLRALALLSGHGLVEQLPAGFRLTAAGRRSATPAEAPSVR
ncbi:MAG: DNA-processing protein DprA [Actinomycetota bacterium]|nr:DNA-processing protein DprA [Actinomycetota bacterium]